MPEHPDTLIWVAGVKPALAGEVREISLKTRDIGCDDNYLL